MSLGIDWEAQQITISSPQTTVLIQDLIDYIREQEATDEGIAHGEIATASGKEELGTDVYVGISVNLISPWQLKFWAGNYIATIKGGNLVGGIAGDPVAYTAGVQVLIIQSAASTIVTTDGGTGSGGLTQEEHDALMLVANAVAGGTVGLTEEEHDALMAILEAVGDAGGSEETGLVFGGTEDIVITEGA